MVPWPRWPFTHDGLIVAPLSTEDNAGVVYAEVVPAGSRWLPWFGRTSRWWFEVHSVENEGGEPWGHTWAYTDGGSGGGFTLAACVRRARNAVCDIVERVDSHAD